MKKIVTAPVPIWPQAGPEDIRAVTNALKASRKDPSWLSSADGRGIIERFEKRFSKKMGVRYGVSMSGGGPALHVALLAAGVQAGDEVVCPTYSWGQSAGCILQANAVPIFADIDPDTFTVTAETIAAKLTSRTRAIIVVHMYGQSADMDPILKLGRKRGIPVIEDAAQATGALYKKRRVGTLGALGCFSIGSGKQIVGGEGGMVLTDDRKLRDRVLFYGHHPQRHVRQLRDPGLLALSDGLIYSYRMHPLAAVICNSMLGRLDRFNSERRKNHERLSRGLKTIFGIRPPSVRKDSRHVYHKYAPSFVPEELPETTRGKFVAALQGVGVPIRPGYVRTPIHLRQTFAKKRYFSGKGIPWSLHPKGGAIRYRRGDCPVAEAVCGETELVLGEGAAWIGDQSRRIDQIITAFNQVVEKGLFR